MANVVTISGMFGNDKTYFADSPVVIDVSGLAWPASSPFTIVRMEVIYNDKKVGDFFHDTGGLSETSFNIQSALAAIWIGETFDEEVEKALSARSSNLTREQVRYMREYFLRIYTEYLASDGVFTRTQCTDSHGNRDIPGGKCLTGGLTEWERTMIGSAENADVSYWNHTGVRNGDASTKPVSSPERVGRSSITSWVDMAQGYTKSIFYPASQIPESDDVIGQPGGWNGHAPIVLRDSIDYVDFLFVNRRGAVETCSALMLENMNIDVETQTYSRVERPSFIPSRSMMTVSDGIRRSWEMSSGGQTREWTEWWATEFLVAKRVWMFYKGVFTPVTVEPSKKSVNIYSRAKSQMSSVEFTVTLALEG